jgi:hypothetical protein
MHHSHVSGIAGGGLGRILLHLDSSWLSHLPLQVNYYWGKGWLAVRRDRNSHVGINHILRLRGGGRLRLLDLFMNVGLETLNDSAHPIVNFSHFCIHRGQYGVLLWDRLRRC